MSIPLHAITSQPPFVIRKVAAHQNAIIVTYQPAILRWVRIVTANCYNVDSSTTDKLNHFQTIKNTMYHLENGVFKQHLLDIRFRSYSGNFYPRFNCSDNRLYYLVINSVDRYNQSIRLHNVNVEHKNALNKHDNFHNPYTLSTKRRARSIVNIDLITYLFQISAKHQQKH
jgi:hypothetical protein